MLLYKKLTNTCPTLCLFRKVRINPTSIDLLSEFEYILEDKDVLYISEDSRLVL